MREKQQAAREQERHRRRTIESYCQDVLQRQEEFEHKVREQLLLLVQTHLGLLRSIYCHRSVKGKEQGCEIVAGGLRKSVQRRWETVGMEGGRYEREAEGHFEPYL